MTPQTQFASSPQNVTSIYLRVRIRSSPRLSQRESVNFPGANGCDVLVSHVWAAPGVTLSTESARKQEQGGLFGDEWMEDPQGHQLNDSGKRLVRPQASLIIAYHELRKLEVILTVDFAGSGDIKRYQTAQHLWQAWHCPTSISSPKPPLDLVSPLVYSGVVLSNSFCSLTSFHPFSFLSLISVTLFSCIPAFRLC